MNINAAMAGADNPYIIGRPIYERNHFFGRKDLFLFIQDNLKQGVKVILLHGQRRIGKSSVLSQIPNFVQLDQFVFIPLSLQGKSHKPLSDIFHELALDIIDYLSDEIELSVDNVILPSKKALKENIQVFTDIFLPQVYKLLDYKNLVLLLDEFDVLDGDNQDVAINQFFPYLKSIVDQQEKLFIIPVVGRQLEDMNTLVLGLFREAPKQEIGLLNEPNAERLIIEPAKGMLEYNPDAIQAIRELSAGHPYFMQILCFALFSKARDEQRSEITRADVESVVEQAISIGEGGLAWFRDGLPIPERVIFSAVAEAQKIAATKANQVVGEPLKLLEEYGVVQTKALEQAGKRLVEWGFLDVAEGLDLPFARSHTYKIKIELVRRWLIKKYPLRQEIWELENLSLQADNIYEEAMTIQQQTDSINSFARFALYEKALDINPNHFSSLFEVAYQYIKLKSFGKALNYYRRAYKIDPVRTQDVLEWLESLPKIPIPPCPYQGLSVFGEEDAAYFFGRNDFTEQMVDAVHKQPLVAVIGASGCGKSSAVFAGLLPRLRSEKNWLINAFRPGDHPFHNLAVNLVPLLETEMVETEMSKTDTLVKAQKLAIGLQQRTLRLQDVIIRILEKKPGSRLLLVVDQFEELYTLCCNSSERQEFLDQLLTAINQVPNLTLVLTLRADFLGDTLSYRSFAEASQNSFLYLGGMSRRELLETIILPVKLTGVQIEDGLTERILDAVEESPGSLPLLELTLTQLWSKQQNGQITHRDYEEIGGLNMALAVYAEKVYSGLNELEQKRTRKIFLQLVRPGKGTEDTGRLATRVEIGEDNWDLVRRLASARLVVTGGDKSNQEFVEIAHEVLIRKWERLREWIESERSFRTWQERLRAMSQQWEVTKKDEGALLRGVGLAEAEDWQQKRQAELSSLEQNFIKQSLDHQRKAYRATNKKKIWVGFCLIALTVQIVGIAINVQESHDSFKNINNDVSNDVSFSPNGKYLVTKTFDKTASVLEAKNGREVLRLKSVNSIAISPDEKLLASVGTEKNINIWNLNTGKLIGRIQGNSEKNDVIAISPDGKTLISGGAENFIIWNLSTWQIINSIGVPSRIRYLAISPDGKTLAINSIDNTTRIWDLHNKKWLNTDG